MIGHHPQAVALLRQAQSSSGAKPPQWGTPLPGAASATPPPVVRVPYIPETMRRDGAHMSPERLLEALGILKRFFAGTLPAGVKEYKSATNMVWILGRIYCTGTPEDYKAVHALHITTAEELRGSMQRLQKVIETATGRNLEFSLNDRFKELVVRISDRQSGEVLKEIPSKEFMQLRERLNGKTPGTGRRSKAKSKTAAGEGRVHRVGGPEKVKDGAQERGIPVDADAAARVRHQQHVERGVARRQLPRRDEAVQGDVAR